MDTSEDNRSWQQVLRREGKGSQAKVRAPPDDRRVAPALSRPPTPSTGSMMKPLWLPPWLCLALAK